MAGECVADLDFPSAGRIVVGERQELQGDEVSGIVGDGLALGIFDVEMNDMFAVDGDSDIGAADALAGAVTRRSGWASSETAKMVGS